ncbi:response regulator PleD [mine drainage metagenome]|uniref:Response regulator PleD n=1 Tax=mine drainage metagenome TaxID=410659 RepID=A0A1J5QHF5_9ZZZZ
MGSGVVESGFFIPKFPVCGAPDTDMDDPATLPLTPVARNRKPKPDPVRSGAPTLAQLGWRLLVGGVVLFALLIGLWLWTSWTSVRQANAQRALLTASLLAVNAETIFQRVQDDLMHLGDTLGDTAQDHPEQAVAVLKAFQARHAWLGGASVWAPDGGLLAGTLMRSQGAQPNMLRDAPYASFREDFQLALRTRGLSVGRPQEGRLLRQWFIPLRYVVRAADGRPLYVLQTSILLNRQQELWRGLPLKAGTAVGLLRTDGWLISRYPDTIANPQIYRERARGALIDALAASGNASSGFYFGKTVDGQQRDGAWARLEGLPIVAFLSLPHSEVVAEWWRQVRGPLLGLCTVLVVLLAASITLIRGFVTRMVGLRKQMNHRRAEELSSSGVAEIDALLRQLVRSREQIRHLACNRERALLEAAQAGTYTRTAHDGVLVAVDASFARMLGRPARRLIGREWDELFKTAGGVPIGEAKALDSGRRLVWTRGPNGETIWLSLAEHAEITREGHKILHGLAIDVSERENLLRAVERQSRRLHTLWELAAGSGTEDHDGGDSIERMLAQGRDALGLQAAIICLRLGDDCFMAYAQDIHGRFQRGQTLAPNHPLCACENHEDGTLWIADASRYPGLVGAAGIGCVIRLPLTLSHQTMGCLLLLGDVPQGDDFDPVDRQYAELLAAWFARVLHDRSQRDTLLSQAYTDGLTGLLNRRAAQLRMDEALQQMRRGGPSFSVALCDLDHFKQVNDEYGHAAGDSVLRQMASTLRQGVPRNGWVARWGGEEFLIMMPGFDTATAAAAMDVLRQRVSQRAFLVSERSLHITLSIGIGTLQGPQDETVRVLTEADDSLYEAKGQGRNRVIAMR